MTTAREPASAERCEELRDALNSARAHLEPPRDSTTPMSVEVPSPGSDPINDDVAAEIARLEQALREAGCEDED